MNGAAAEILKGRPASMGALLQWRIAQTPAKEAFRYRDAGERWVSLTWTQTGELVRTLAAGLLSLGIAHEQREGLRLRGRTRPDGGRSLWPH